MATKKATSNATKVRAALKAASRFHARAIDDARYREAHARARAAEALADKVPALLAACERMLVRSSGGLPDVREAAEAIFAESTSALQMTPRFGGGGCLFIARSDAARSALVKVTHDFWSQEHKGNP